MRTHTTSTCAGRPGFVGLIVLMVAMAIGAVIYFIMIRAVLPDVDLDRQEKVRVWDEAWRLDPASPERLKAAKKTDKWLDLKPLISETLTIVGDVQLAGEQRGKITLTITKDGKVKGKWAAQYDHETLQYDITAQFQGVTDPTNTFIENGNARPELLYVIARGTYEQKSYDTKTNQQNTTNGVAWVSGWLNAADAVRGEITLTTDQTWSSVYTYTAEKE
jgi:hypothetical protein